MSRDADAFGEAYNKRICTDILMIPQSRCMIDSRIILSGTLYPHEAGRSEVSRNEQSLRHFSAIFGGLWLPSLAFPQSLLA